MVVTPPCQAPILDEDMDPTNVICGQKSMRRAIASVTNLETGQTMFFCKECFDFADIILKIQVWDARTPC